MARKILAVFAAANILLNSSCILSPAGFKAAETDFFIKERVLSSILNLSSAQTLKALKSLKGSSVNTLELLARTVLFFISSIPPFKSIISSFFKEVSKRESFLPAGLVLILKAELTG